MRTLRLLEDCANMGLIPATLITSKLFMVSLLLPFTALGCDENVTTFIFLSGRLSNMENATNTPEVSASVLVAKLQDLDKILGQRIRGQSHVIPRVVSVLQRGELGLTKSTRPRGSFMFLGPTGVGKTEITLTFTEFLFGCSDHPDHIKRQSCCRNSV